MRARTSRLATNVTAAGLLALLLVGCSETTTTSDGLTATDSEPGLAGSFELTVDPAAPEQAQARARLAAPLRLAWAEHTRLGQVSEVAGAQMHIWPDATQGTMVDIIVRTRPGDLRAVPRLQDAGMTVTSVMSRPALVMGSAPVGILTDLAAVRGVVRVDAARPMERRIDQSIDAGRVDPFTGVPVEGMNLTRVDADDNPVPGVYGEGVVVGVVDTGIDYRHQDFRNVDGSTRILSIWDQSDCTNARPEAPDPDPTDADNGPFYYGCPDTAACGSVYTAIDIDCELGVLGGDDCLGAIPVLQEDVDGHGTHVASTAAGSGPLYRGVAPMADIIMVKFDFDNECERNSSIAIVEGIRYIFDQAGDRPAVVNLSLGSDLGAHTGLSAEELGINALVEQEPGRLVMAAAGNAARNPELNEVYGYPMHGRSTLSDGGFSQIVFDIPSYEPDPIAGDYLAFDIWLGHGEESPSEVDIIVAPPSRNPARRTGYGFASISEPGWGSCLSTSHGRICVFSTRPDPYWELPAGDLDNEIWVTIDDGGGIAPVQGNWIVQLNGVSIPNSPVQYDSWVVTSRSLSHVWTTYDGSGANNEMTVGSPAMAEQVVSVAAYTTRSGWTDFLGNYQEYGLEGSHVDYYDPMPLNELCFFSSRGGYGGEPGRRAGSTPVPFIAAPGGGIVAAMSSWTLLDERAGPDYFYPGRVVDNGDADGLDAYVVLQGTSMATPHATGGVAVLLGQNAALTPELLRDLLAETAVDDGPAGHDGDWGFGRFDIDAALGALSCIEDIDCDDGNGCTTESCVNGLCQAGGRVVCDNSDPCNGYATCNPADGECHSTPITVARSDDGCCPVGADLTTDSDCCTDVDDDGYYVESTCIGADPDNTGYPVVDCDDSDDEVYPDAIEVCNGVDDDCSGTADDAAGEDIGYADFGCSDGVDNDCDGLVDCDDDDCNASEACCDVDGDGYVGAQCGGNDCDDGDRSINPGEHALDVCDGVDNDCDGVVDEGVPEICGDGVDQDCDGLADCDDPDCAIAPACCTPTTEVCGDGVDNDCDAAIDCDDSDCAGDPACDTCTPVAEDCNDGIDNDCDGAVDCDDSSCDADPACTTTCVRMTGKERGDDCGDGLDNDCDGFIDCDDNQCAAAAACTGGVTPADEVCDDGTDNDGDGAVDCADSDCAGDLACCTPTGAEICDDGVDNDCDGATDCADSGCSGDPVCPSCSDAGAACSLDSECCSGRCHPVRGCR